MSVTCPGPIVFAIDSNPLPDLLFARFAILFGERVSLDFGYTSKRASNLSSMPETNWEAIGSEDFELLIFHLVKAMGFEDPRRIAGSGDRGEDIVAFQPPMNPGILSRTRLWVFQCKRTSKLRKSEIEDELANFASKKLDTWMLVSPVKPSPEFRRWFDKLRQNQKYGFHIQAWWRDELEDFLVKYVDHLIKYLPDRLVLQLELEERIKADEDDSLPAILARLRWLAESQIDRFARGKYIPRLYVPRRLQLDVLQFSASESKLATQSKASSVALVEASLQQLRDYVSNYDNTTNSLRKKIRTLNTENAQLTKKIRRIKTGQAKKKGKRIDPKIAKGLEEDRLKLVERRQLMKLDVESRESNKIVSIAYVGDLVDRLSRCLSFGKKLPTDRYFTAQPQYQSLSRAVNSVLALLDSKLKDSEVQPRDNTIVAKDDFTKEPEIQMLSDDGFVHDFREALRAGLTGIDQVFRNTLVIIDRAGSGKTNMVCHLVKSLANEQAIVLLFGKEHFQGPDSIIRTITEMLSKVLGGSQNPVLDFDSLLEKEGRFLTVFIDGINENRRIGELDSAIAYSLEWARTHRIKFVLTCRDIYWEFFNYEGWGHDVQKILREELNQFSRNEYLSALPLYLEFYHIDCELADEAKEACHHPLLLRFFCEAYGSVGGPLVSLGTVRDIRLKELFDIYLLRKADQIRRALNHRNSDKVSRYLLSLVRFMFKNLTTVIPTTDVEDATGDADTSTQDSLYLHLLDEDIIIEEQPGDDAYTRRVTFVYEEFMEYLLARSIVTQPKQFGIRAAGDIFLLLDSALSEWVNARGVGEYVALMLFESESERSNGIEFLRAMVEKGKTWSDAFWSIIGKFPEAQLDSKIFDLFAGAIDHSNIRTIRKTLSAMTRYSQLASNQLASVLLWSVALPTALTWTALNSLEGASEEGLKELGDSLAERLANRQFLAPPGKSNFDSLLVTIVPFVTEQQKREIGKAMRDYGGPTDRASSRAFIRVFWKSFPQYHPMLINGLFTTNEWTRSFCADRLRFTKAAPRQTAYLCQRLSEVEADSNVKQILSDSSKLLALKGH